MSESLIALMRRLTTGVDVLGVGSGSDSYAFTASSIMPASFDPVMLALALGNDHACGALRGESACFAINVLRHGQLELARHFGLASGRDANKLAGMRWRASSEGAPLLPDALAWRMCRVHTRVAAGGHELVVARVTNGVMLDADAGPMIYAEMRDMDGSARLFGQRRVPGAAQEHTLDA